MSIIDIECTKCKQVTEMRYSNQTMASDAVKDKPCPDCGSERRVIWNSPPMSRMAFEAGIHYGTGVDGGKYYGSQKALDNDLANRGLRRS